jgi:hypothetical protein
MATPEKLSLWDRWFNRYRKTINKRGSETWHSFVNDVLIKGSKYKRDYIEYLIMDRVTGSERIEREYI